MRVHGRDAEIERLDALGQRLVAGEPGAVVIEGDAGMGKTALVDTAVTRWQDRGVDVWRVTVSRSGLDVSVSSAESDDGDDFGPPALLPLSAQGPGPRVNAVLDAIDGRSGGGPLAVVVDDVHWCDATTAVDLGALARRLGGRAVVLAVTSRPAPRDIEVDRLVEWLERNGAARIALTALPPAAVAALTRDRLGADPGPTLQSLLAGAGGNPLIVDEALRTLEAEAALVRDGDTVDVTAQMTLPPLQLAVLRRSSLVPDEAIGVLRMAAVLGPRFRVQDLAVITGQSTTALAPLLIELTRSGLIVDDGDHLAFRHDLVHDALYRDIPRAVRSGLHRDAALALHGAGRQADALVEHLVAAGPIDDSDLLGVARSTARSLIDRQPGAARRVARAALDAGPLTPRADLAAIAARAAAHIGDVSAARAEAGAVLAADPDLDAALAAHDTLVTVNVMLGAMPAAVAELETILALDGLSDDDRIRREALVAYYRIWSFDLAGARRDADAVLTAHSAPQMRPAAREATARAHEVLALVELADGRAAEALDHARTAHAVLARPPSSGLSDALVHQALALSLFDNDRMADAVDAAIDGLRVSEEIGTQGTQVFYATSAAMLDVIRGRLDDAVALAETAIDIVGDSTVASPVAGLPHAVIGRVALFRGDLEGADQAMTRAGEGFATSGPVLGGLAFLTWNAEVHHAAGRTAEATALMSLAWQLGAPARYLIVWRNLAVALARLHVDAPLPDALVADILEATRVGAERAPHSPSARAAHLRVLGLVTSDVALLAEAATLLAAVERPLDRAECLLDATRLAPSARSAEVRSWRAEAAAIAQACGATGLVDRAAAASRRPGARATRPTFGWASLTPTELVVADLTAQGLTNPQIGVQLGISRRTAETHLSHVFTKLGITNRAQLAAEMARRTP